MVHIVSWQDLAEESFFHGLSEERVNELGLQFKPGKQFSDLVVAVNNSGAKAGYWDVVATREGILKDHLEGNLTNDHDD